jgi:hypothetical protein
MESTLLSISYAFSIHIIIYLANFCNHWLILSNLDLWNQNLTNLLCILYIANLLTIGGNAFKLYNINFYWLFVIFICSK